MRAYQLSSRRQQRDPKHEAVFAYRLLKPLTPEQAFDSATVALGMKRDERRRERFIRQTVGASLDEDFSRTWEYRETVQGLMSRLALKLPASKRPLDELYQRVLTRKPTSRERKLCRGRSGQDVAFALLNSNEFFFNH